MTDISPKDAYAILRHHIYEVASWPRDMNREPLRASLRELSATVDRVEILQRDLRESNLALESERKARREDIEKIDYLQKKLKDASACRRLI